MLSSVARLAKVSMSVLVLCAVAARPPRRAASRASSGPTHTRRPSGRRRRTSASPCATPLPPGAQVLKYRFGPLKIQPGQNMIDIDVQKERPNVDGWIVGFRPGLVDAKTGKNPPVTEVHLHHAVWLVDFKPTFAAGEEKTNFTAPSGFGWRYTTKQTWLLNHMIHDLVGQPHEVYITYTSYFIPDTAPRGGRRSTRSTRSGWTSRASSPTRSSTRARARGRTASSRTPTRPRTRTRTARTARATSGSSTTTRRSWPPPGTCTRAGCGPTST